MDGDFRRTIEWPRPLDPERVWSFVTDDRSIADCSPHVENVRAGDHERTWTARLVSQVGRLRFAAPVEISLSAETPGDFLAIAARGHDRRMGTRLHVDARLELHTDAPGDGGRRHVRGAQLTGHYTVRGKAADLAPGVVQRHAALMVDAFWQRFTERAEVVAGEGSS